MSTLCKIRSLNEVHTNDSEIMILTRDQLRIQMVIKLFFNALASKMLQKYMMNAYMYSSYLS